MLLNHIFPRGLNKAAHGEVKGRLSLRTRGVRDGFTLIELLVAITIVALLCGLGFSGASLALQHGRRVKEVGAAKSLIAAYLNYPTDNYGGLMVGMYEGSTGDLGNVELKDGTKLSSTELHRYPFRLYPYLDGQIDGTFLVNRNGSQISGSFSKSQFNYGLSLCPALGINYYFVGGYSVDGVMAGDGDTATNLAQVVRPNSLLVFASAFTEVSGKRIDGRFGVEPPKYRTDLWDENLHVDGRYGGKAVCAFLDGTVRSYTIEELRDMRLWSMNAAAKDDPNYTVQASGASAPPGGGGRR